jgi:hypothetical protein
MEAVSSDTFHNPICTQINPAQAAGRGGGASLIKLEL